jgi:hypothetical protein
MPLKKILRLFVKWQRQFIPSGLQFDWLTLCGVTGACASFISFYFSLSPVLPADVSPVG